MISKSIFNCLSVFILVANALPHPEASSLATRNATTIDIIEVDRKISNLKEPKAVSCSESLNGVVQGHNRNYAKIAYTQGQVKAAMLTGAALAAKDKVTGESENLLAFNSLYPPLGTLN